MASREGRAGGDGLQWELVSVRDVGRDRWMDGWMDEWVDVNAWQHPRA